MQFYFIRHAQSENNALYLQNGSSRDRKTDPDLTFTGDQQTQYLTAYLAGKIDGQTKSGSGSGNHLGLTHIYTSLMLRAVKTSDRVARALDLPLLGWLELHENGGLYLEDPPGSGNYVGQAGYNRQFFHDNFPRLILPPEVDDQGWWKRPFETEEKRPLRAARVLEILLNNHDQNDRIAVISHAGFYNQLMRVIFQIAPGNKLWFQLDNTAITRIDFSEETTNVVYMNSVDFLPSELVTYI